MMRAPLAYNLRSLFVRKSSTLLTVVSIGATVAVLSGVLALEQGFTTLFSESGREDVAVFLRPGATSEGDSGFSFDRARVLIDMLPEIETDELGRPYAAAESYLAVRLYKLNGGETNVPIRGVQPASFDIVGDDLVIVEGANFRPGTDEVIVGEKLARRIEGCAVGEVIQLNTTPFRVTGVFACDGPYSSEIWGDLDRMGEALERPVYNRVVAIMRPDTDLVALAERMEENSQVPAKVMTEREYLSNQTGMISSILQGLGFFLATIMGVAAVFTATNTMLAALASRTHEIGVLLSIGFRPFPIFLSFLMEAVILGLLGGLVGVLLTLPLSGIETGTTNFQTFTEVAFAFRVTPSVLTTAVSFALVLGLIAGAWPAWRAAHMDPVDAMRRG
jgi:putative ABC transport system permease protein